MFKSVFQVFSIKNEKAKMKAVVKKLENSIVRMWVKQRGGRG